MLNAYTYETKYSSDRNRKMLVSYKTPTFVSWENYPENSRIIPLRTFQKNSKGAFLEKNNLSSQYRYSFAERSVSQQNYISEFSK